MPKVIRAFTNRTNGVTSVAATTPKVVANVDMDAQTNVAIAAAIHMYFNEMHDFESNVITIRPANNQYSPWSSTIYGVSNQPVNRLINRQILYIQRYMLLVRRLVERR